MNRITLNNNIQMPMLGFGTFLMGGSECEKSVLAAIRSGYRMIDTAEAYGNEETVGSAIVKSGIPREELFLVTKVNFRSYENTRETVEASLNKLKTSYLDLVLLHWPFGKYANSTPPPPRMPRPSTLYRNPSPPMANCPNGSPASSSN